VTAIVNDARGTIDINERYKPDDTVSSACELGGSLI